jgi:hypothetical protein
MPVMMMLTGENGIQPVAGFFFSVCGDRDQGRAQMAANKQTCERAPRNTLDKNICRANCRGSCFGIS